MMARIKAVAWLLVVTSATVLSAVVGSRASRRKTQAWYRSLRKSPWNPPDAVFGPVWTTLYALETWSAGRVSLGPTCAARHRALALWFLQQGLNAAWSPLFFGHRRARAALLDLTVLWLLLPALYWQTRKVDRTAAIALLPYVAWVTLALHLNYEIVRRNPRRVGIGLLPLR